MPFTSPSDATKPLHTYVGVSLPEHRGTCLLLSRPLVVREESPSLVLAVQPVEVLAVLLSFQQGFYDKEPQGLGLEGKVHLSSVSPARCLHSTCIESVDPIPSEAVNDLLWQPPARFGIPNAKLSETGSSSGPGSCAIDPQDLPRNLRCLACNGGASLSIPLWRRRKPRTHGEVNSHWCLGVSL